MNYNEKLKQCPFCGEDAEIEQIGNNKKSMIISCTMCSCTLETNETVNDIINNNIIWNQRIK